MAALPTQYRSIFQEYNLLNDIQKEFYGDCFHSDKCVVISASTGSGKSVALELGIIRLIDQFKNGFKAVYLAPLKVLCKEKAQRWSAVFSKFNLLPIELTGDTKMIEFKELSKYQLILTTPEKWDSMTRKWRQNLEIMSTIRLVMIDEVHLLNEPKRGPTLEAVISRMKFIDNFLNSQPRIRYMAISATIPNADDIGAWLGAGRPVKVFHFTEDQTMTPLEKHIFGFPCHQFSNYQFDIHLNYKLGQFLTRFGDSKPTLIFCSTRKGVELTAKHLAKSYPVKLLHSQKEALCRVKDRLRTQKLQEIISTGVAYHHAGLSHEDRSTLEGLFKAGNLPILVCTNTFAMGVNLPAYLVIVKSTNIYGSRESIEDMTASEYSCIELLQMIGRAGRGGKDSKGIAIILTKAENVVSLFQFLKKRQEKTGNSNP